MYKPVLAFITQLIGYNEEMYKGLCKRVMVTVLYVIFYMVSWNTGGISGF